MVLLVQRRKASSLTASPGIKVDLVGELGDIDIAYYCPKAGANILSLAAMSDEGADIRYDSKVDRFTMKPKGSDGIYSYRRHFTRMWEPLLHVRHKNSDLQKANDPSHEG
jgi:hypothetical protein